MGSPMLWFGEVASRMSPCRARRCRAVGCTQAVAHRDHETNVVQNSRPRSYIGPNPSYPAAQPHQAPRYDVVLSSGFLAFAAHAGFLQAVEEAGLPVGGVMGTSAGALTGSLYCAGYTPSEVARHLSQQAPASLLRPSLAPWQGGVLSLEGVVERLRELLPPTFEELEREFAVGVVTADGEHVLIDSGPLPEAVAASAAIPFIFESVEVPGSSGRLGPLKDGGVADRIGLKAWRDRRRRQMQASASGAVGGRSPRQPPPCLVHVIDRSSPFSGFDDAWATGESSITVLHSPRSRASLLHLGAFHTQLDAARSRAALNLAALAPRRRPAAAAVGAAAVARRAGGSVMSSVGSRVRVAGARVAAAKKELEAASGGNSGSRVVVAAAAASGVGGSGVEVSEGAARRAGALAASLDAFTAERVWAARHMQL